jgi:hypothetical protein
VTEQPWIKRGSRARRRLSRRIGIAVLLVFSIGGAALLGLAVVDKSALPSWIPLSWAEAMPNGSVLRRWVSTSWDEAKARVGLTSAAGPAAVSSAELKDYEFQLVKPEAKQGDAVVVVRLVHKPSGRSVPDAVVFAKRIDMAPEGMPTMTAPLEPAPPPEPGTYGFKTNLMMEGGWQLSLAAKVQGETGTVQNRLVLKAVP